MYRHLSAEETFFKELPEPEQARARNVCELLDRRHQLRGLPVLLFIVISGTLLMAEMKYHYVSPITTLVCIPFVGVACSAFYAKYVKHHTVTIWEFARYEAEVGGEEVKFALYKMADEAPNLVPSLAEFVRTLS